MFSLRPPPKLLMLLLKIKRLIIRLGQLIWPCTAKSAACYQKHFLIDVIMSHVTQIMR